MDYTSAIITSITLPVIFFVYRYLSKTNQDTPTESNGVKRLSIHKFFFYFGITISIFGVFLLFALLYLINDDEFITIVLMILPVAMLFLSSGLFYYYEYKNAFIEFDNRKVSITNFRKNVTVLKMDEINSVSHNSFMNRINIKTDNQSKSFNQNFKGIEVLLNTITEQTGVNTDKVKHKINAFNFGYRNREKSV